MKTLRKHLVQFGSALIVLSGILAFLPGKKNKIYTTNYENVLGTSMEIKIAALSEEDAAKAEQASLKELDRLNKILSGYDFSSEFMNWMNAGYEPFKVSPELYEVLSLFEQWRIKSNGALDASAETISTLWRNAGKQNQVPSSTKIATAVSRVQKQHYILMDNHTVRRLDDAPLMLNSFAKTFIMDKVADAALATKGISGLVLNIGGDIVVRGQYAEQIQVSDPKADAENDASVAQIKISNKSIATSGNYRRGVRINGKWYSHIVNPQTGWPVTEVISATVVANGATDAGALATALNVLSPEQGKQLVASIPGAEYLLITSDGRQMESDGWKNLKLPAEKNVVKDRPSSAKDKLWDADYELAINLEIATIEGMRVRRPFVAVWVVDEKKKPLRQVALWYNKPRWLNEMRSWYAAYNDKFATPTASISSTTSATRAPGKYTLKWDGKDDEGNYVSQGKYTVYIEVAREHGTHQLMTQEIDVKKQKHLDLAGNIELASASLDYRKKADGK